MILRSTLLILFLTSIVSTTASAQTTGQRANQSTTQPTTQTFTSGELDPTRPGVVASSNAPLYVASPLDANFKIKSFGKKPTITYETQTVDIRQAVASYADLKKVSMSDSLLEALEYLGGMRATKNQPNDPKHPRFKSLGSHRYAVTAPDDYFRSLAARIKSFELGKQSVVIEVEYLHLDDSIQFEARKFMIKDSVKQISGGIPQVTQQMPEKIQDSPYEVVSTLRTSKSLPVTIGQMDPDGYKRFKNLIKNRSDCGIVSAPTLVTLPGLDGIFQSGSVQNFIVGVEQKTSTLGMLSHPIVQQIERGRFFRVSATPVDSKVRLECSMAFAKIAGVGTQDIESDGNGGGVTVQTPAQQVRQIDLNATIAESNALFVDPYYALAPEVTKSGKTSKKKQNLVAIIRAKVIAAEQ